MTFIQSKVEEISWNLRKDIKSITGVYDTVITNKLEKLLTTTLTEVDKQGYERGVEEGKRMERARLDATIDLLGSYLNIDQLEDLNRRLDEALTPPETEVQKPVRDIVREQHINPTKWGDEEAHKTATS